MIDYKLDDIVKLDYEKRVGGVDLSAIDFV